MTWSKPDLMQLSQVMEKFDRGEAGKSAVKTNL